VLLQKPVVVVGVIVHADRQDCDVSALKFFLQLLQ